jgi:hypothetical protein
MFIINRRSFVSATCPLEGPGASPNSLIGLSRFFSLRCKFGKHRLMFHLSCGKCLARFPFSHCISTSVCSRWPVSHSASFCYVKQGPQSKVFGPTRHVLQYSPFSETSWNDYNGGRDKAAFSYLHPPGESPVIVAVCDRAAPNPQTPHSMIPLLISLWRTLVT